MSFKIRAYHFLVILILVLLAMSCTSSTTSSSNSSASNSHDLDRSKALGVLKGKQEVVRRKLKMLVFEGEKEAASLRNLENVGVFRCFVKQMLECGVGPNGNEVIAETISPGRFGVGITEYYILLGYMKPVEVTGITKPNDTTAEVYTKNIKLILTIL